MCVCVCVLARACLSVSLSLSLCVCEYLGRISSLRQNLMNAIDIFCLYTLVLILSSCCMDIIKPSYGD